MKYGKVQGINNETKSKILKFILQVRPLLMADKSKSLEKYTFTPSTSFTPSKRLGGFRHLGMPCFTRWDGTSTHVRSPGGRSLALAQACFFRRRQLIFLRDRSSPGSVSELFVFRPALFYGVKRRKSS